LDCSESSNALTVAFNRSSHQLSSPPSAGPS
jgi:hypothetical protein